jgi:hypothetical protein
MKGRGGKGKLKGELGVPFVVTPIAFSNKPIYEKSQPPAGGCAIFRNNIFFMSKRKLFPICFVKSNSPCRLMWRQVMMDPSLMRKRMLFCSLSSIQFANN